MALCPTGFVDIEELSTDARTAMLTSAIEEETDSLLLRGRFNRVEAQGNSSYNWPQLMNQLKAVKYGVAYVVSMSNYRTDISNYKPNEIQAAYKRLRRAYQSKGWKNVIFCSNEGVLYYVALIKEG